MMGRKILIFVKQTILIALSVLLVSSAIGLSYRVHYCHGSVSGIAFYPELGIAQSNSCGCALDSENSGTQPDSKLPVLSKNSCCSNVSFFSKLTIESPVNNFSTGITLQQAVITLFSHTISPVTAENEIVSFIDLSISPPPLAGRQLVLFLSQQRIPAISYIG